MNLVYQCKKEIFWFLFYVLRCDLIMMRREKADLTWKREVAFSKGMSGKDYDSAENQKRIVRIGELSGEIHTVTKRVRWAYFHYRQARQKLAQINREVKFQPT